MAIAMALHGGNETLDSSKPQSADSKIKDVLLQPVPPLARLDPYVSNASSEIPCSTVGLLSTSAV
jgi:hypothetical protein